MRVIVLALALCGCQAPPLHERPERRDTRMVILCVFSSCVRLLATIDCSGPQEAEQ